MKDYIGSQGSVYYIIYGENYLTFSLDIFHRILFYSKLLYRDLVFSYLGMFFTTQRVSGGDIFICSDHSSQKYWIVTINSTNRSNSTNSTNSSNSTNSTNRFSLANCYKTVIHLNSPTTAFSAWLAQPPAKPNRVFQVKEL